MPRIPKSTTSTPGRAATREASSTPKPSSPRNRLPIPATRTRSGLHLGGREEEPVPALAEVAPGVVVDQHPDVHTALHVALDHVDDRGPAGERDVEDVAARAAGAASPAFQPVARQRPQLLLGQASVRSRISRVRGSVARISAFSSSVSARMFSASSPSISPPSNRSPGDSGAIRGWSSRMIGDGEHRVVAHQHRPRPDVRAARGLRGRHEAPAAQHRVRRAHRVPQRLLTRTARPTASCCGS